MKNLEKFGVQELGTQEMRVTDGGMILLNPYYKLAQDVIRWAGQSAAWELLSTAVTDFEAGWNSVEDCDCE